MWLRKDMFSAVAPAEYGLRYAVHVGPTALVKFQATPCRRAHFPLMQAPTRERNNFYRRALRYYIGFFSLFGLLLTAASPELFEILVDDEFYAGYVLLPWLVGAVALHSAGSITFYEAAPVKPVTTERTEPVTD